MSSPMLKLVGKKVSAPIAFLNHTSAVFTNYRSGCTTGSINTTSAKLIVASVSIYQNFPAFTDSQGNTWTQLNTYTSGQLKVKIYYCINPTVSASHTFSLGTGVTAYANLNVMSFSGGSISYETITGSSGSSPLSSGSLTPTNNKSLIITALVTDNHTTAATASSPFSYYFTGYITGQRVAGGIGYYIQPTAASIGCTWTWTGPAGATTLAVFY